MQKHLILFVITIGLLLSFTKTLLAQTDTEFWFVAPEVTNKHEDTPIRFKITSFGQASTVTISMPAHPGFTPIVQNIVANQMITVDLTPWIEIIENRLVENAFGDDTLDRGILITATAPVTAYYEIGSHYNREIYALKGKNSLGKDFIIPIQNKYDNQATWYDGTARNAFDIVATEDNTHIKIIVTADAGYTSGQAEVSTPGVYKYTMIRRSLATGGSTEYWKWKRIRQTRLYGDIFNTSGTQIAWSVDVWIIADTLEGFSANNWTAPTSWTLLGQSDTVWHNTLIANPTYTYNGSQEQPAWSPYCVDTKTQISPAYSGNVWEKYDTLEYTGASLPSVNDPSWVLKGYGDTIQILSKSPSYYANAPTTSLASSSSIEITPEIIITPEIPAGAKYHPGDTIEITLNKGETYSVVAYGKLGNQHLSGSKVTSDKPIAISIKDDSINILDWTNSSNHVTCNDIIGDQIVPIDIVGTDYIAIKGSIVNNPDYEGVFITATEDLTDISVGGVLLTTIGARQTYFIPMITSAPEIYIKTSKPAYAYQLTGTGCEAAGALLPPIICTGSKKVAFSRTTSEAFTLILLAPKSTITGFTLSVNNGAPILIASSNFVTIPGNSDFMAAHIDYTSGPIQVSDQCVIENTMGFFHMGFTNGGDSTGAMYGYFSDYGASSKGTTSQIRYPGCDVVLDGPEGGTSFKWSTGAITPQINLGHITKDTTVWVVSDKGLCGDSTYYTISPVEPKAGFDVDTCIKNNLSFIADVSSQTFDSLAWYRAPDYTTIKSKSPIVTLDSLGDYGVIFSYKGCLSDTNVFHIKMDKIPTVAAGIDTIVCAGTLLTYTAVGSDTSIKYLWASNPSGFTANTAQITIPTANAGNTTYIVTVTSNKCGFTGTDDIAVSVLGVVVKTDSDTLYTGCSTLLTAPAGKPKYFWSTNPAVDTLQTKSMSITKDTTLKVWYYSNKCKPDTSIFVVHPFMPTASYSDSLCTGGSTSININTYVPKSQYNTFAWFDAAVGGNLYSTYDTVIFNSTKTVWLELYYKGCTSDRYPFNVKIKPLPVLNPPVDTVVCLHSPVTIDAGKNLNMHYLWSTGDTTQTITINPLPTSTQTYFYTVTITNECMEAKTATSKVKVVVAQVDVNNDTLYSRT